MSKTKIAFIVVGILAIIAIAYYIAKRTKTEASAPIVRKCKRTDVNGNCLSYDYTFNGIPISGTLLQQEIERGARVIDDDLTSF